MIKLKRNIFIVVISMLLTGLINYFGVLYYADMLVTDKLYQKTDNIDGDIKIVTIDEKTLESLGSFNTWDREVYARLLNKLYEQGKPLLTAFDIIYSEDMEKTGDMYFAQACKAAGNVVVVEDVINREKIVYDSLKNEATVDYLNVEAIEPPYDELAAVTAYGFADTLIDKDGYVRNSIWKMEYQGTELKSFARVIYEKYAEVKGTDIFTPKQNDNGSFGVKFSGAAGDYDHFSMVDVLQGNVDSRIFDGSIVLVGAYANGMQDNYNVPISHNGEQMYGVEIQANIIQALIEEKTTIPIDPIISAFLSAVVVGICMMIMVNCRMRISVISAAGMSVAYLVMGKALFIQGYTIMVTIVPLMIAAGLIVKIAVTYINEAIQKRRLLYTFKKYVAPQVVDKIVQKQGADINLSGEERDIAVLFMDIRSFTSLSESMPPAEVVEILNKYLNMATLEIFNNSGTVDKFIGDEVMAVFNAPFDLEDYEYKAVCTGWQIIQKSKLIQQELGDRFSQKVECGVGINCGTAVVGNIGSEIRMEYTAIGDTVNTASRLEGRAAGGQILITEEMAKRLKHRISVQKIDVVHIKGKKNPIALYEVIGIERDGEQ